jgi:hypothetical protein
MGENRNASKVLVGNLEKYDVGMDWINLAQDRDQ